MVSVPPPPPGSETLAGPCQWPPLLPGQRVCQCHSLPSVAILVAEPVPAPVSCSGPAVCWVPSSPCSFLSAPLAGHPLGGRAVSSGCHVPGFLGLARAETRRCVSGGCREPQAQGCLSLLCCLHPASRQGPRGAQACLTTSWSVPCKGTGLLGQAFVRGVLRLLSLHVPRVGVGVTPSPGEVSERLGSGTSERPLSEGSYGSQWVLWPGHLQLAHPPHVARVAALRP